MLQYGLIGLINYLCISYSGKHYPSHKVYSDDITDEVLATVTFSEKQNLPGRQASHLRNTAIIIGITKAEYFKLIIQLTLNFKMMPLYIHQSQNKINK